MTDRQHRLGVLAGFAAYGLWGVFPLVFRLLDEVSAVEILFHRIAWSLAVVVVVLAGALAVALASVAMFIGGLVLAVIGLVAGKVLALAGYGVDGAISRRDTNIS